ncbi:hypothetical protein GCM10011613_32380 [Cellvibrio zantedeschiae]|uniref:Tetratricopeptide repeat protein n=1 Tax=Cellvibrio zantedeschiae TaxID=1237077 RepID=A0ABQ3B979_9GAMM|nr:tetratricopeptide repeat protein [Cellvibrio zantedeschiae]GGY84852.1 hypothetical protein GCM10011613_32380 [Cellvibrio zantedeschiae]
MNPSIEVAELSSVLVEQRNKLERYIEFLARDANNEKLFLDTLALALEIGELNFASQLIARTNETVMQSDVFDAHAGYLFLALGDYKKALAYLSSAVSKGLENSVIIYNMANCYFHLQDFEKALNLLGAIPQVGNPLPIEHMILKARLLHYNDDLVEAIQHLQELIQIHGFQAEAAGLLSLIMFESNSNYTVALDLADKALQDNPLLIEALLARISLNLERGNYVQAESDAFTATQHYPEVGRAWASLAQVHFNNLQFDLCKESAQNAVHFMTNHIGSWHLLAWANIMLGDFDNGLKVFKESYALDQRFAETHGGLAASYAHLKQTHLAEKHIKIAQKLNPQGFAAIYAQMILLNNDNNTVAAQALFEKSINQSNAQIGATPKSLIEKRLFELSGNLSKKEKLH